MPVNDKTDRKPLFPLEVLNTGHAPERNNTIGEKGRRKWIYSDIVHGKYVKSRDTVGVFLIGLYFAVPFISVGGNPLLRFDIPNRRFSIFGHIFLPTDIFLLTLFLLLGVVGLFLFSALLGRLWCGWGCPQTVYLEGVFRRIERIIEGSALERRKLDRELKDDNYRAKKLFKHSIFILISGLLALCFASYFVGPEDGYNMLSDPYTHPAALIIAIVLTGVVYFEFAWFREQFCTFICPYARFQSVMLDEHSLIIGYDPVRGEPRGPIRPDNSTGDCIDCKRCVQVCPTGIDIRDGLQLECVNCTACIDACNHVMDKIDKPQGLIRYDSLAGIAGLKRRIFRPRIALYVSILTVLLSLFVWKLSTRELLKLSVVRPAGIPYIVQEDGTVRNRFEIHCMNTDSKKRIVTLELDGQQDMQVLIPGQPFEIESGQRITAEAFVMWHGSKIHQPSTPLQFLMKDGEILLSRAKAKFLGPIYQDAEDKSEENHHE